MHNRRKYWSRAGRVSKRGSSDTHDYIRDYYFGSTSARKTLQKSINLHDNDLESSAEAFFAILRFMQDQSALTDKDIELIKIAGEHAKKRFKKDFISIGGALRTKSGKIYTGINLKYRVRNTSTCAETMAIYTALNNGETGFDTVVGVKYFPETDSFEVVNACGWCRQLYSYSTPLKIIIDNKGVLEIVDADQLMPYAFL